MPYLLHTETCVRCNTLSIKDLCLHTFPGVICARRSIILRRGRSTASSKIKMKANCRIAWQYVIGGAKAQALTATNVTLTDEKV